MYEELIDEIEKLSAYCHDKYNINWGGCCYFAYLLARELEKIGVRYKLVIEDDQSGFKRLKKLDVRNSIRNKQECCNGNTLSSCCHYTLQIDGVIVNNEGCRNYYDYLIVGCVKPEEIEWLYKVGSWNNCYKTRHNKIVEQLVVKTFKKYEERRIKKQRKESKEQEKGSICFGENCLLSTMQNPDKSLFV